jgi:putative SOS response-associated peptidase YedK
MVGMCGRYTLVDLSKFTDLFPWLRAPTGDAPGAAAPRYNIAPSQPILAFPNDGRNQAQVFAWGLIPSWADDPANGNRMINARAESLAEKPAFRTAFRRRRCLIPADGFYEWRKQGKRKTPMYVRMKSHQPFAFAGLWEVWRSPDGSEVPSCTIITTEPNELLKDIHNRMPAVLRPEHYKPWLDPGEKRPDELRPMLAPYPADGMEAYEVSTAVNSPSTHGEDCIAPAKAQGASDPARGVGAQEGLFG